jgi:hypothetical protein
MQQIPAPVYGSTYSYYISQQGCSDTPLDDATHSALFKGLNFAVTSDDILHGVEKAISTLSEKAAEGVQQNAQGTKKQPKQG